MDKSEMNKVIKTIVYLQKLGWEVGAEPIGIFTIWIKHKESGYRKGFSNLDSAIAFAEGFKAGHEW